MKAVVGDQQPIARGASAGGQTPAMSDGRLERAEPSPAAALPVRSRLRMAQRIGAHIAPPDSPGP